MRIILGTIYIDLEMRGNYMNREQDQTTKNHKMQNSISPLPGHAFM